MHNDISIYHSEKNQVFIDNCLDESPLILNIIVQLS